VSDAAPLPARLAALLDGLEAFPDPSERGSVLVDYANRFEEVPPSVATRPYSDAHKVPACESDAYVWAVDRPDGTMKLYFAVESPAGVSARALAAILDRTLSGLPPAEIAAVPPDIVERIFRRNISMGKGLGLMSMVRAVQTLARRRL